MWDWFILTDLISSEIIWEILFYIEFIGWWMETLELIVTHIDSERLIFN